MISIRRLFLRDLLGLFGLLAALSVGLAAWGIHRTLNQQIAARADEHLDRVQRDLANHLAEAANLGTSLGHAWQEGMFSLERPERLAKAEPELRLLLEAVPSVVTVCIYDTAGRGLVLSHHREGFRTLFITQGAPAFQGRVLRERGIPQDRPYLPKAPYDPTTRPWFVAARESSGPRWIPPYAFQNADNQGLTYVVPLRDAEGRFRGVVSIDQSLGELSDRIWRARPTPGTRTLVCDEAGRTLIVPRDEPPPPNGLRFLRRLGPDFLPAFAALQARWARVSHPKEFLHFSHGGERWAGHVHALPAGGQTWHLMTLLPGRDYRLPALRFTLLLLGIGLAFLALFAWRAVRFSRQLAQPLARLAEAAEHLGSGRQAELSTAVEAVRTRSRVKEVHSLSLTLAQAAEAIEAQNEMQMKLEHGQRLQTVGTLAGGIAHDVNNQLAAIVGQLALGRESLEPGHPAHRRLARAEEAAERCSQMVRSLLSFSHQAPPQLKPMDLNEAIRHTGVLLERVLGGLVRLDVELSPEPLPILGDAVQLEQVVLNLAVNARDAMPEGGHLAIRTAPGPQGTALLTVADTGCGIPEAHLDRIFEPFFTTKDLNKGTGLGLAMVFGIVRGHGGSIEVESRVGEGTTFRIALPATGRVAEEEAPEEGGPQAAFAPLAGRRILVAEDDPHLRELFAEVFSEERAQVDTAPDGSSAWTLFSQGRYDLVMSDQRMPGLTGLELLGRIRASGSNVPVVLASGYGLEGREKELAEDPAVCFLHKPFRAESLLDAASALLRAFGR